MYRTIKEAVIEGNDEKTVQLVKEALEQGEAPVNLITSGLQAGLTIVGDRFSAGEFFIPEMLLAARAVSRSLKFLRPLLSNSDVPIAGRVVMGTVAGDIHDIGKNLVCMLLEGAGFEVIDLGTDVSPNRFITAVKEYCPDILGMSALLTTTLPVMVDTIRTFDAVGIRDRIKIIVGGAPVTPHFAAQIGADGYGADGGAAMGLCRKLLGK